MFWWCVHWECLLDFSRVTKGFLWIAVLAYVGRMDCHAREEHSQNQGGSFESKQMSQGNVRYCQSLYESKNQGKIQK